MATQVRFAAGHCDLACARRIAREGAVVAFDGDWRGPVAAAAKTIADVVAGGAVVYGVNTGFGSLARTAIPADQLRELQLRLVRSHCAGVGAALPDPVVRLVLALKANALARGFSGVRVVVVETLLAMLDRDVLPRVPAQGSVGASGDLAPLAHLSAALIGEGVVTVAGAEMPAAEGLARVGLAPLALEAKEGLALLNGTQVSTALALIGLFAAEDAFAAALMAGALSLEAMNGSDTPFDPRIHAARGQPGQIAVAEALAALLAGSRIRESHIDCDRVQDPYSLRCQPQVMGACLDQMRMAAGVLERESNAVSDNPLVFSADGAVLSGGNFHAEPVAMAADQLAVAIAEIGALSERRTALLVDNRMSGLPAFLTAEPGLNSGFMIAQVTAAALASENKGLAWPASVDSLPTSANQEDHVSMAAYAARRLTTMGRNAAGIVAIELLAAAQGLDFHRPMESTPTLMACHGGVRAIAARLAEDRPLAGDIAGVQAAIADRGLLAPVVRALLPSASETAEAR